MRLGAGGGQTSPRRRFGPYTVELSNLDKVLFPEAGLTKGDLVDYYQAVAAILLPYIRGRPLTMQRFPDGIDREGFIQKEAPEHFPSWIPRVTVAREGGVFAQLLCENTATLVYLANQGCVTPHVWLSRADKPDHPDRLIFDLDPPSGSEAFALARRTAGWLRELLSELGLVPFVMTTGGSGLHVLVPLRRAADFTVVRRFAQDVAGLLARREPEVLTTEVRKGKRGGRLYLDTQRNGYAQTAVPPYAVRARPHAPVATPLEWGELDEPRLHSQRYTVTNLGARLTHQADPWQGLMRHASTLTGPRRRLDALLSAP